MKVKRLNVFVWTLFGMLFLFSCASNFSQDSEDGDPSEVTVLTEQRNREFDNIEMTVTVETTESVYTNTDNGLTVEVERDSVEELQAPAAAFELENAENMPEYKKVMYQAMMEHLSQNEQDYDLTINNAALEEAIMAALLEKEGTLTDEELAIQLEKGIADFNQLLLSEIEKKNSAIYQVNKERADKYLNEIILEDETLISEINKAIEAEEKKSEQAATRGGGIKFNSIDEFKEYIWKNARPGDIIYASKNDFIDERIFRGHAFMFYASGKDKDSMTFFSSRPWIANISSLKGGVDIYDQEKRFERNSYKLLRVDRNYHYAYPAAAEAQMGYLASLNLPFRFNRLKSNWQKGMHCSLACWKVWDLLGVDIDGDPTYRWIYTPKIETRTRKIRVGFGWWRKTITIRYRIVVFVETKIIDIVFPIDLVKDNNTSTLASFDK